MKELIDALGIWGVPACIITIVLVIFVFMQVTGEIIEWCGKTAPIWLKLRKIITRKRDARRQKEEARDNALLEATKAIQEFNKHYNPEAIKERDEWISWVNKRADVYDTSVSELLALKSLIEGMRAEQKYNSEIAAQLYKDFCRNRILDFAHALVNARKSDKPVIYSREEFRKIHTIHTDYEKFLKKYKGTNGEVDDAMIVIRQAERGELPNIEFLEDLRD